MTLRPVKLPLQMTPAFLQFSCNKHFTITGSLFTGALPCDKTMARFSDEKHWFLYVEPLFCFVFIGAGKAFMEAAQLQINLQSKHEAGQRYVDAGNCFKKTDVEGRLPLAFA